MPFTAYHFGPSGLVGLVFRKWLDIPVFLLANIIVDIEVLYWGKWPYHRYVHTLLIGAAVGLLWGAAAYPLRNLFKKVMRFFRLPYHTSFLKMLISGVLGVWLHVLIDAIYHWDVRLFWPSRARPLFALISNRQVEAICLACFIPAFIVYAIAVLSSIQKSRPKEQAPDKTQGQI
jgi:membrane-bound metal-dependent hydrolase YbcI (DUF457 family)